MREPVRVMRDRILTVLDKAGRNKRQANRKLNDFERDLRQQTGEKNTEWTEEYYSYLLETYSQAIDAAIPIAVEREEYEWAEILTARKVKAEEILSKIPIERE